MENSVGTFRTDRLMQGDRPSQVTVNTGSTVRTCINFVDECIILHYIFATIGPYAVLREKYEVSIILLLLVLQVQYTCSTCFIIIPLKATVCSMFPFFP